MTGRATPYRVRRCMMCHRVLIPWRLFITLGGRWPRWLTNRMDCGGDCLRCMEALGDE